MQRAGGEAHVFWLSEHREDSRSAIKTKKLHVRAQATRRRNGNKYAFSTPLVSVDIEHNDVVSRCDRRGRSLLYRLGYTDQLTRRTCPHFTIALERSCRSIRSHDGAADDCTAPTAKGESAVIAYIHRVPSPMRLALHRQPPLIVASRLCEELEVMRRRRAKPWRHVARCDTRTAATNNREKRRAKNECSGVSFSHTARELARLGRWLQCARRSVVHHTNAPMILRVSMQAYLEIAHTSAVVVEHNPYVRVVSVDGWVLNLES